MNIISQLEAEMSKKILPEFNVGDTIDVPVTVIEGDKERVQVFNGVVIARQGAGLRETFTVRRIVQGEGIERVFLIHSPRIGKVTVKRKGKPRRAKLYYLRERKGKSVKVKERLDMVPGAETIVEKAPQVVKKSEEPEKPKQAKESRATEPASSSALPPGRSGKKDKTK